MTQVLLNPAASTHLGSVLVKGTAVVRVDLCKFCAVEAESMT